MDPVRVSLHCNSKYCLCAGLAILNSGQSSHQVARWTRCFVSFPCSRGAVVLGQVMCLQVLLQSSLQVSCCLEWLCCCKAALYGVVWETRARGPSKYFAHDCKRFMLAPWCCNQVGVEDWVANCAGTLGAQRSCCCGSIALMCVLAARTESARPCCWWCGLGAASRQGAKELARLFLGFLVICRSAGWLGG